MYINYALVGMQVCGILALVYILVNYTQVAVYYLFVFIGGF